MSSKTISLKVMVWRQPAAAQPGRFVTYEIKNVTTDMSFLEMLDVLNEDLIKKGEDPIAFDSDCREGICGACGFVINGQAHGPDRGTTVCQLHLRSFDDNATVVLEPWRARAFPVIKDLVVDRTAFDRIIQSGGYISAKTGPHPDANVHLIPKHDADLAMDFATCIGCGACVAACPNASAALFTSAKAAQLSLLPQGQPERMRRSLRMIATHDNEGFGNCTNIGECQAACPKEISIDGIARLKRDFGKALFTYQESSSGGGDG